jgi:hypothetical protein
MTKHEITRADIMPMEAYATVRRERRRAITELKKNRRLAVGPDATFYFECYDTMWHQVHEMLHIERGGEAQIPDELSAYNPLIPKGGELVATLMFEIDDPVRRAQVLDLLGGVEETVTLNFEGEGVAGVAEEDVDRTTADGKASSVQFLHFPFTAPQIETFRAPGTRVTVAITHPGYDHQAGMAEEVRQALAEDFD